MLFPPLCHTSEETIDSDVFIEWAVCIVSDKTWMHTPEALAKHYISYNAKVCFITVALWALGGCRKKRGFVFFFFSNMVGGFWKCLNWNGGSKQNPALLWFPPSCSFCSFSVRPITPGAGVSPNILPDTLRLSSFIFFCSPFLLSQRCHKTPLTESIQTGSHFNHRHYYLASPLCFDVYVQAKGVQVHVKIEEKRWNVINLTCQMECLSYLGNVFQIFKWETTHQQH